MKTSSISSLKEDELSSKSSSSFCGTTTFCHRICVYIFPVCALVVAVILVGFAFKTPRPAISLGFSFLLLILAILYCVIGNAIKFWMSESEQDNSDSESGICDSKVSIVVISSSEEEGENV